MSRTLNGAALVLAGLAFVVAIAVPLWLSLLAALACLLVGGALLEHWFLDD